MPTVIKRNLFMVFSSHQSLLPVTSMVKSAVMLWDQFWFGVFCVWVFTVTAASPRQSLEGKCVWTNQGDCRRDGYVYKSVCVCACVHSYVRVLLQKNCGVITSQLSMLAPCVCVCWARFERGGEVVGLGRDGVGVGGLYTSHLLS